MPIADRPWTVQPDAWARIAPEYADRLAIAYWGDAPVNRVSGPPVTTSGTLTPSVDAAGRAIRASSSGFIDFGNNFNGGTAGATALIVATINDENNKFLFSNATTGGGAGFEFLLGGTIGDYSARVGSTTSGNISLNNANAGFRSIPGTYLLRFVSSARLEIHHLESGLSAVRTASVPSTGGAAAQNMRLFSRATTYTNATVNRFFLWPYALNDALFNQLREAPLSVFEPRRIWVPMSVGGGPAYTLDLETGSYTTTGNSATLSASRRLDLNAGSYSLLGNQVTLTLVKTLTLDAGSYSLTGQSAQLTVSRRLDLNAGSYSVSGNSAELTYTSGAPTYTLDLLAGSYSLTGNSVNLFASRNLTLGRGNYTITGRSATLTYSNAAPVLPPVRPWYYIPGPIPTTAESWLVRELQTISQATYGAAPYIQMEPRAVEPDKPREGMLAFADGVNWNPGSGAGVYVRASGAWVKL